MILIAGLWLCAAAPARAQSLGEPEFLSVKTKRAELREQPDKKAPVLWRLWKYMPVEVVAYRGDWVRVRDLDGDQGWMGKDALCDVPAVMVSLKEAALRASPNGKALWLLERGYALRVFSRKGDWLEVSDLASASGWIHKSAVWGAVAPPRAAH